MHAARLPLEATPLSNAVPQPHTTDMSPCYRVSAAEVMQILLAMLCALADPHRAANFWIRESGGEVAAAVFAGPAIALAPLALAEERIGITAAVACLTAAVGLQGFCYAGYHAYVQVRPLDPQASPDTA